MFASETPAEIIEPSEEEDLNIIDQTQSDEDNYKKHSIISAIDNNQLASMATTNLLLQEVPVTYAYTFFFENSNLNLGVNLKYINALFYQQRVDIGKDTNLSKITSDFKANIPSKSASNFYRSWGELSD